MTGYVKQTVAALHDPITGALLGLVGADGKEYLFPTVSGPDTGYTDASATPGAATVNAVRGKVAIAAAAASVVVTNSLVTPASHVVATLDAVDATLTSILRVVPAAGSFTVTGNVAATGAVGVKFTVFN